MDIDDIILLQQFTLSDSYFAFSDRINKQVHGCAMGGPVSFVMENLCMKQIKESAISDSSILSKNWRRYLTIAFASLEKTAFQLSMTHLSQSTGTFCSK